MALLARVQKLVVTQMKVQESQVTETATFTGDLNADSLEMVEMVMALEDEFGIEVPDEDTQSLVSVGDVVKYLQSRGVTE